MFRPPFRAVSYLWHYYYFCCFALSILMLAGDPHVQLRLKSLQIQGSLAY